MEPETLEAPPDPEIEGGFDRRVLRWVVAIATLSLLGAIVLSAFGQEAKSRLPASFSNSYGNSALGQRAFVDLLRRLGLGALSRRSSGIGNLGPKRPLVVAEPASERQAAETAARVAGLAAEALEEDAALVFVLPKWDGRENRSANGHPDWIGGAHLVSFERVERLLGAALGVDSSALPAHVVRLDPSAVAECKVSWPGGGELRLDLAPAQLLELKGAEWQSLVSCSGGVLVARLKKSEGRPEIVVVADPDLLNNQGLGRAENATLAAGLFSEGLKASGAVFDETIHGFNGAPGLLAEAIRFPMVLAVLHGALLLAVVLWAALGRFGKPLSPRLGMEGGKEVLIESTAQLLNSGGEVADSADRYYRQTLRGVAGAFGLPLGLAEGELRIQLQKLTERAGVRFDLERCETTLRELQGADRKARVRAVALARRLYQWRMEMMHGNRESR